MEKRFVASELLISGAGADESVYGLTCLHEPHFVKVGHAHLRAQGVDQC